MLRKSATQAILASALSGIFLNAAQAAEEKPKPAPIVKEASNHVKCDGDPDNMSAGESAARIIALTAVIGLLAPAPEASDPTKRKTGTEGVAVCDLVLEGEKAESNPIRRIRLRLARAIHQIEAKKPELAMVDVAIARKDAETSGLSVSPYFRRSLGLSFDKIDAAALLRMGKLREAAALGSRGGDAVRYDLFALVQIDDYAELLRDPDPVVWRVLANRTRLYNGFSDEQVAALQGWQKFAEAAKITTDMVQLYDSIDSETHDSGAYADAALALALSGDWGESARWAERARANDKDRVAKGNPEKDRSENTEKLDLVSILTLAHNGNLPEARRLFAGRSDWLAPSVGAVLETNARLRSGAKPEELLGLLAKTPDQFWSERRDAKIAEITGKDGDNANLYKLIRPFEPGGQFEGLSGKVWKTDKSKIFLKEDNAKVKARPTFIYGYPHSVRHDAVLLHSALMAKTRGETGLITLPTFGEYPTIFVRTGNKGNTLLPDTLYFDAADVVAQLSEVVPDPATLKARREATPPKK
jgi:hypothetical protein